MWSVEIKQQNFAARRKCKNICSLYVNYQQRAGRGKERKKEKREREGTDRTRDKMREGKEEKETKERNKEEKDEKREEGREKEGRRKGREEKGREGHWRPRETARSLSLRLLLQRRSKSLLRHVHVDLTRTKPDSACLCKPVPSRRRLTSILRSIAGLTKDSWSLWMRTLHDVGSSWG